MSPTWVPVAVNALKSYAAAGVTTSLAPWNTSFGSRMSTRTVLDAVRTDQNPSLRALKGPAGSPVVTPGMKTTSPATTAENGVPEPAVTLTVKLAWSSRVRAMPVASTARSVRKAGEVPAPAQVSR